MKRDLSSSFLVLHILQDGVQTTQQFARDHPGPAQFFSPRLLGYLPQHTHLNQSSFFTEAAFTQPSHYHHYHPTLRCYLSRLHEICPRRGEWQDV